MRKITITYHGKDQKYRAQEIMPGIECFNHKMAQWIKEDLRVQLALMVWDDLIDRGLIEEEDIIDRKGLYPMNID